MKTIEIYGQDPCKFCTLAEGLLISRGYSYSKVDVKNVDNRRRLFERAPHVSSVPQIFVGEHHVGGFEDLDKAIANGSFKKLVEE